MRVDDAISPSLIMSSTGLASIPKREPACPRTETSPLRLLQKQKSAPVTKQLMPSLSPSHCSTNASAGSAAIATSNGIATVSSAPKSRKSRCRWTRLEQLGRAQGEDKRYQEVLSTGGP